MKRAFLVTLAALAMSGCVSNMTMEDRQRVRDIGQALMGYSMYMQEQNNIRYQQRLDAFYYNQQMNKRWNCYNNGWGTTTCW